MLPRIPFPRDARHFGRHTVGTLLGAQSFLRGASLRLRGLAVHPEAPMQILVRHNLLITGSPNWSMGRNVSMDDYRATLFAPDRLALRLAFLRGLLIPSLASQTLPMQKGLRELVLLVSDEMPQAYVAALEPVIAPFDWIRLHPLPSTTTRVPPTGPATLHFSVRIDDDDALSRDFVARLSRYFLPQLAGHAVTFPAGNMMLLQDLEPRVFAFVWRPKLTMGLAYLAGPETRYSSIYQLMPHNDIDRMVPTVFGDAAPAWLRSLHETQDDGDYRRARLQPRISLARVQRDFDFDPARLTQPRN